MLCGQLILQCNLLAEGVLYSPVVGTASALTQIVTARCEDNTPGSFADLLAMRTFLLFDSTST